MSSVDEFLSSYPPNIQELALKASILIKKAAPKMVEIVDLPSKIMAYGFSPKYADLVCAIAPYQTYVNLIFSKGTQLPDPHKLLTGTGKRARHVKIEDEATINNPGLEALIA